MAKSRNRINGEGGRVSETITTTSGTSHDFTNIPDWVTKLTPVFDAVSIDAVTNMLVQLGDSGGIQITGYNATEMKAQNGITSAISGGPAGFYIKTDSAAQVVIGNMVIERSQENSQEWVCSYVVRAAATTMLMGAGDCTLANTLTQLRLTTVSGTANFDAGSVTLFYE